MNQIPKGGDLHHHFSGAIYAENYLDWAGEKNYCVYIQDLPEMKIEKFQMGKLDEKDSKSSQDCISVQAIRSNDALYRELLMKWSDKDFSNHFHSEFAPDQQFFSTFAYFTPAAGIDYRGQLEQLKERAEQENIQYLETMVKAAPAIAAPAWEAKLDALSAANSDAQALGVLSDYLQFMQEDPAQTAAINDYVTLLKSISTGMDDDNFTVRFQSYVARNAAPGRVFSGLYSAFSAAAQFPEIVGVNFVSPENGMLSMRDYHLHMLMFHVLKQKFPSVKTSLHAGELVLGMVPPEGLKNHIDEAVLLANSNRIGHGIDIVYESNAFSLLDEMRKRKVAVEINLTSNEFILGVKDEAHPISLYAEHGVPYVISTDDAGVSRINLSGEYVLYASRYKPSYETLKNTIYNSINYSFMNETDKRQALRQLDTRFGEFEAAIAKSVKTMVSPGGL